MKNFENSLFLSKESLKILVTKFLEFLGDLISYKPDYYKQTWVDGRYACSQVSGVFIFYFF